MQINKANSFDKKRITTFTAVEQNQAVDTPVSIEGKKCRQAKGSKDNKGWIKTSFGSEQTVFNIEIYNPAIKGSSYLQDAVIYIGENVCTKVDSSPPTDQVISLECIDTTRKVRDVDTTTTTQNGIKGSYLKIESKYEGDLTACDITIIVKETD